MKKENYILTEYGFDKEKVCARDLCDVAATTVRGYIYPPFNILLISALDDCGEKEFASMVAKRYCDAVLKGNGLAGSVSTFVGFVNEEWISWSAGAYLLIARFAT